MTLSQRADSVDFRDRGLVGGFGIAGDALVRHKANASEQQTPLLML
jgi:hypothetical protein